jgi:uncharacterized protein YqgV (UPF0045/DUF77 family)
MTSTIEISLYPLNNEYTTSVLRFLRKLKDCEGIEIQTNGMSTVIIGEFTKVWNQLGSLMEWQLAQEDCVVVMKVAPGRREYLE